MEEIFKNISEILGYEEFNMYEINATGVLRRATDCRRAKKGSILKWSQDGQEYLITEITAGGKPKKIKQHRAIACLFLPNPRNLLCVDHVNGNREDNRLENLRWCNNSENGMNSKKGSNNSCGFKNILKTNDKGRFYWKISIIWQGKQKQKYFRCNETDTVPPPEVIGERNRLLIELHGDFARFE